MPARIVTDTEPVLAPPAAADARPAHASIIDQTRDILRAQPKVEVRVHADSDVPVQINGYTFLIQPNVKVKVPEAVAAILEESGYL